MKTTLTRESASKVRLTVEASANETKGAVDRAVRALGNEVKVPGFRKGHVPRQILETRLGKDTVREAALREAIPELLAKAVESETLQPIAAPQIEVRQFEIGSDLEFEATVEVRPEVELPDLTGLRVRKPSTAPSETEVDEQVERLRDRFATLEAVPRPARAGDFVLADFRTTVHTEEIEQLSGADQLYEVGSGTVVPEVDKELEGKRAGDILKFNATLPEGSGPHAGREVTFQILVKEVRQKILPPLDDDFAKTASEFETLDELRADLAQRIGSVKEARAEAEVRSEVLEAVLDEVDIEAPESLVQQEMAYRLQRFEEQLKMSGMTFDQYMQAQEFTEEQIEADLRRQAERNVRAQLILEEIGRSQDFQVTEDEIRDEIRYHAEVMRAEPDQLANQLDRDRVLALAGDIIRRKALNYLVEQAEIETEDPDQTAGSPPND